ncbi:hypothetical protein Dsin_023869 [Dipteronia sinensis]|uniref:Uncharacterized protein n=1 Tax=Dipteronia sinensis TaxID=43782 RepID=A0AAE0E1G3_9ROSI|nr:hypothetical protein Dsin_023869 [Dipteronia sinensis]
MSKGGRLVMIKSVLASLPKYLLSVFSIPTGVASKIEKLQRDFFWGDSVAKRKIHSIDWVSICKSKKQGGLGIDRMSDKSLSLMSKWVWRFGRESASLWKKVL